MKEITIGDVVRFLGISALGLAILVVAIIEFGMPMISDRLNRVFKTVVYRKK